MSEVDGGESSAMFPTGEGSKALGFLLGGEGPL